MKTSSLLSLTLLTALYIQARAGTNEPPSSASAAPLLAGTPAPLKAQQPFLLRNQKWFASPSIHALKKSTNVSSAVSARTNQPPAGAASRKAPFSEPKYEFVPMTTPELAERRAIFGFKIQRTRTEK